MALNALFQGPWSSQEPLPGPRHLAINRDQSREASLDPAIDARDKIKNLLLEMKGLQDQIEQIQGASQESQVEEPLFKKIKPVLDNNRAHLIEIKESMQQQQITHDHQMSMLQENMIKAQGDVKFLLGKMHTLERKVSPADQPR